MVIHESIPSYGKYVLDEFEFENGEVLKDVEVEYIARGTPEYDENGNIINAVVFCHRFNGSCHSIDDFSMFFAENGYFNEFNYFYICISSLGFPNSCSPSTTNLKYNFPSYTIFDRVNFRRQFLREYFNIDHVLGVFAIGLGGFEAYTWAVEYPDEMDFIVVMYSSFKTYGYRYVASKVIDGIIESSDEYYNEIYSESLSRITVSIFKLIYSNYFSKKIFSTMSNDQIDALMDDFVDEGLFADIYDIKYRNDTVLNYDVEDKLGNIKAKTLLLSPRDDIYYTPELDTIPAQKLINGAQVFIYDSKRDYTDEEDFSLFTDVLIDFLKDFEKNRK
ncbi:homoserine acetyltransferase [Methanobrevibacter sp.]|uniref:homoserine acetyltransferase n=1 Tax=Methanobrevibacter sp. TaxID=66852 RepID=UPI00388D2CCB